MKKIWIFIIGILLCGGCARQTKYLPFENELIATATISITPSPTASLIKTPTVRSTISPTPILSFREYEFTVSEPIEAPLTYISNLWTQIPEEKITHYPNDFFSDYVYDQNGDLWICGAFGIIHQKQDGNQVWYSILNDLPSNHIHNIDISPSNELWAVGYDRTLLRFDGECWIDEGEKLPQPYDTRIENWLCYGDDIAGIDFDLDGNIWVMTYGIDLYTNVNGYWLNVPFPKQLLPLAGGGGCPKRLVVNSFEDVTVIRYGCCMKGLTSYHYDGKNWITNDKLGFDDPFDKYETNIEPGLTKKRWLKYSGLEDMPFTEDDLLNEIIIITGKYTDGNIYSDENGIIWIDFKNEVYNNADVGFSETDAILSEQVIPQAGFISRTLLHPMSKVKIDRTYQNLLWYPKQNQWHYAYLPDSVNEELYAIYEVGEKIRYAASGTSVYLFSNDGISQIELVRDGIKPIIISSDGKLGDCSFHQYYSVLSNCYISKREPYNTTYEFLLLQPLADGSLLYANNKILAQIKNGKVRSYLFHAFDLHSVTIDPEENIWVLTDTNGVLKFSPDIFDDYQDIIPDDEK